MTRLTPEMIEDVPRSFPERDADLMDTLGLTLKDLAYRSVGMLPPDLALDELVAAAVPVTSGKGVTEGFSRSVCAILEHLGMSAFVTGRTDVAGLSDAISVQADIIFMADDQEFVALNRHAGMAVNNTRSTARGYVAALERAAGGLEGKHVLLIGAGRVGSYAAELLVGEGAVTTVFDVDRGRAEALRGRFKALSICADPAEAMVESTLIFNASPAAIPGSWIREGAIISSPGVPYGFDRGGEEKARLIVHDPLQIGVAVMAIWSASLSMASMPALLDGPVGSEVF